MKTYFLSLLAFAAFSFPTWGNAQINAAETQQAKLTMNEMVHDFGKIPQGKPVYYNFIAKNVSSSSVIIETVQASCGCTTPEWSTEPIQTGGSSIIKVGYNAAAPGYFEKTISVAYAGGNNILLTIKGEVWKTPDQPAPLNKSIAFLKTLKNSEIKKP
jgi:hypothetical protein